MSSGFSLLKTNSFVMRKEVLTTTIGRQSEGLGTTGSEEDDTSSLHFVFVSREVKEVGYPLTKVLGIVYGLKYLQVQGITFTVP